MNNTPTPHISAKFGEIAPTVIMPGDPKRAKLIAQNYLSDKKLVNDVRGIQTYTGFYKGKKVTVMASGMGNPSMGIYSYELFNNYGVKNIIRVGSCGTLSEKINLGDVIIASNCFTETNYSNLFEKNIHTLPASKTLEKAVTSASKNLQIKALKGTIYCSDSFYTDLNQTKNMQQNNCLGVEMESASLYYNAKLLHKNAIAICTVSDNITLNKKMTAKERETSFISMIELALEASLLIND